MNIKSFIWIFPFLSFIAGYFIIYALLPSKEISTPSLIGKDLYEAAAILSDHHLNIRILAQQEEPSLAQGTILNQMPSPGQKIKPQQSIFLVISRRPPVLRTPHLKGTIRSEIEKIAIKNHLKINYIYLPSTSPRDYCIAQLPSANEPIDRTIMCYLADGKSPFVLIPNFVNKLASEAIPYFESQGITPEILSSSFTSNSAQQMVIDQRPLPGSIVLIDSARPLQIQLRLE